MSARSAPPPIRRRSTRWSTSPSPSARGCARSRPTTPTTSRLRNIFARCTGAPASTSRRRGTRSWSTTSCSTMSSLRRAKRACLSIQLPAEFIIIFEPVTHSAQFIDVKGEPTRERQSPVLDLRSRAHPQPDAGDASRTAAHRAGEPHRHPRPADGMHCRQHAARPARRGDDLSSRPSGCSPTRLSATSTGPTRWTWTSGSRSPA